MRSLPAYLLVVSAVALQMGCEKPAPVNVYRLGERVQVGPLIYNVLEANWRAQIGDGSSMRTPSHRFLVIHLTVTNSGAQESTGPALAIVDQTGRSVDESMDGEGVPNWLGMIRKMKPAETLDGAILFDADPKSYKLKLDDGSGAARWMVELPLQFDAGQSTVPSTIQDTPAKP